MERDIQPEDKTIAERLRSARIAAKLTQQELAGERFSKSEGVSKPGKIG